MPKTDDLYKKLYSLQKRLKEVEDIKKAMAKDYSVRMPFPLAHPHGHKNVTWEEGPIGGAICRPRACLNLHSGHLDGKSGVSLPTNEP